VLALGACAGPARAPASPPPSSQPPRGVTVIEVGAKPCAVAAGPDAVWVSAFGTDKVVKVDPATNTVVATYDVGTNPCGVVYASGRVWVGLVSGHQLVQLDAHTGAVLKRLDTRSPVFDVQLGLGSVWAATRNGHVLRVDPVKALVVSDVTVGAQLYGLAVTADAVWIADQAAHDILRLEPASGRITARIHDPDGVPYTFATTPGALWVSSDEGTTLRIDMVTNRVTATVPFGAKGSLPGDPDAAGGSVWVPNRDGGQLAAIDPTSNQVRAIIPLAPGFSVAQAAFGSIWVCDYNGSTVARVDPDAAR
jgi:virginiamycin B lyase